MMPSAPSPYVRPRLAATRRGIPEPGLLVDVWLDQLLELSGNGPGDADEAYDLLAGWARLRRVRPELIPSPDAWAEAQEYVKRRGAEMARLAADVPEPGGWLEEARRFHKALEARLDGPGLSEAELSEWAARLLGDLDDADLVVWSARQFALSLPELERQLRECGRWLEEHADDWLCCAVFVQAVGQSLQPDLAGEDLDLAMTADKFVVLLDAQERAEDLTGGAEPVPAEVVRALLARRPTGLPAPPRPAHDWGWLPTWLLAADAPSTSEVIFRDWRSPDGVYLATLAVGSGPAQALRLTFGRGDDSAVELAGRSVSLAGVPAVLNALAYAEFALDALRQAWQSGARPVLLVDGVEWQATEGRA
jgi:hypothetical protein